MTISIATDNELICKYLCNLILSKNNSVNYKISENDINYAIAYGRIEILCLLLSTMIKIVNNNYNDNSMNNEINSIKQLSQYGILNSNLIDEWLNECKLNNNSALYSFLTKLNENGLKKNNFYYFLLLLNKNSGNGNDEIDTLYKQLRKGMFMTAIKHK